MKVLLTIQEPGKPRYRYVVWATSTFNAICEAGNLSPNAYISARFATVEDIQNHGDVL